ncbi:hypothetical protein M427DRAFT_28831 [Gonapodya prolifera JEL478]|uniref:Uncharacterized protein n=1 Tax=Gonapodya prolifera (strain JEL478) TaxID=1344416 RepID=A0A139ATC1_GONPJ|nr:hypothetical protein M427DRAFT_28831 [Gonapodya prolifera JEL478]|eukprot:KXS19972.1 hypothetical protein M427DRAFT_28831 [Gonapodya prolifera JEL478]
MPPVDVSKLPTSETPVKYNRRDLILYAIGIGIDELRYVYELDKNFAAFPTFPIVLPFRGTSFDVIDFIGAQKSSNSRIPGVKLDPAKVLDGERFIEILNPLPLEGELIARSRTSNVYDVGKAAILENETLLVDKSGKPYVKMVGQAFFRDAGGFGGPRPPKQGPEATPPSRPAEKVIAFKTSPTQAQVYRLSGDYNPLHIDPAFSGRVGFKVPILHGLCSWGIAAHSVLKLWGDNDASRFVSYKGRFTAPVLPGETLQTESWLVRTEGDKQIISFQVRIVERNIIAIGGGVAVIKAAGSKL